jgi:SWI/SNF related-matrix-associated actin-dependent regulator of chromatin subfamily C
VNMEKLEQKTKTPPRKVFCNSCGVDTSRVYFHNAKPDASGQLNFVGGTKMEICPRCLVGHLYPKSFQPEHFAKVEQKEYPGVLDSEQEWSDEEVLRLLEGLEVHDDDWNAVANMVETKTREQCVMKFLQLEIEDKYLESDIPQSDNAVPSVKFLRDLEYLAEGRMPIYHGDNPILSVVSFMAGLAPANVTGAAVAAQRSVKQMRQIMQEKIDKVDAAPSEKGKEKEGEVKNEDAMEVDSSTEAGAVLTAGAEASDPLATLPFALSAARASALASHEERHVTRLVSGAVNLQLQKLQLKMSHFNDFEKLLSAERRDLQRRRQQLFMDRLNFQRRVRALEDATKKINSNLGGQGLPGALNHEDAISALTEAIQTFGVGKGEEGVGAKRDSVDEGVQPVAEGAEGFARQEI